MLYFLLYAVFGLAIVVLIVFASLEIRMLVGFWRVRRDFRADTDQADDGVVSREAPTVTVQIAIYNEGTAVLPLLRAVAEFDYPRDRMDIQVLDDSTDATPGIVCAEVTRLRAAGLRVAHVRRDGRAGFKAGALAYGLRQSDAEFVAMFDADFVPPPDFLRRALVENAAFDAPDVAFVQGRWSYMNWDRNLMTRSQAIFLDRHFAIQKPYISRTDRTTVFNGSGCVLRRAAIDAVGGWSSDTLCEDLDLGYRFALNGWTGVYDAKLDAPSELPETMAAFKLQQRRWVKGSVQCFRKLTGDILTSTHLRDRSEDLHVVFGYVIHPVNLVFTMLWPLVVIAASAPLLLNVGQTAFVVATGVALISLAVTVYETRRGSAIASLRDLIVALHLGTSLMVNNTIAFVGGCVSRSGEFHRTPKAGNLGRPARGLVVNWSVFLELAYICYMFGASLLLLDAGYTMEANICRGQSVMLAIFFLYQFIPQSTRIDPVLEIEDLGPVAAASGNKAR